ncbi:flagellin N-terminal helical domain-containing protein [Butyrivibrio sp. AE2015]|uniref:flagellin N-terminal helical domain-containing protein n=1 Tax=Butyrivibrio sp. AE2015 TaxID=1280663 RepID=UPI0003B5B9FD|nr:flagellin [Butyrivibrio sp. AE2015]
MKVNYNVSAMIANNSLQKNDKLLSESLERLSSGLKIANAKDNPSGLAMSRRMNSQIEGLGVANASSNDAISIVQVADGTLSEIHEVLQRMNQLAVQASNGTLTDTDRQTIQAEVTLLKEEIERMADTTQFNGQSILDGSFDLKGYVTDQNGKTNPNIKVSTYSDNMDQGTYKITGLNVSYINLVGTTGVDKKGIFCEEAVLKDIKIYKDGEEYMTNNMLVSIQEDVLTLSDSTGKKLSIQIDEPYVGDLNVELTTKGAMTMQVGANEGQTLDIRINKISLTTLGLYNLDLANEAGAREGIDSIKNAISEISAIRSRLGAYQNRLEHTVSGLDITVENMTAAYSRIMDVDMAEEMTVYSTQQVLSQAGTSMMAQANERPSQVLQLLQ